MLSNSHSGFNKQTNKQTNKQNKEINTHRHTNEEREIERERERGGRDIYILSHNVSECFNFYVIQLFIDSNIR